MKCTDKSNFTGGWVGLGSGWIRGRGSTFNECMIHNEVRGAGHGVVRSGEQLIP